jgi:alpha-galactosidase
MFTDANQAHAVVFNYAVTNRYYGSTYSINPIKLKGLAATKKYQIKEINLYPGTSSTLPTDMVYSGDYLMNIGINPNLNSRRTSVILELTEVK